MAGSGTAHLRTRDPHSEGRGALEQHGDNETDNNDGTGNEVLLSVEDLRVEFTTAAGVVRAVSGISFDLLRGETLGIVGESGCGKSTTGRAILRLGEVSGGRVRFAGADILAAPRKELTRLRRRMQMIFQDPVGSLNPRRPVRHLVTEGLAAAGASAERRRERARAVLDSVGLEYERFADRLPRQLSGGQAQRVAIARALAVEPELIVCDEAVSALDVSVQAQIINLIEDIKDEFGLTVVFIAHDLGVVRTISDRVMVMYLGKICELGEPESVYASPAHPYTRALLDSVPRSDLRGGFAGPALGGDIPSPLEPPSGCRFRTRCPRAQELCAQQEPQMAQTKTGQYVACHFPLTD
ncbi:ABC transporter ATP-binding protein [Streptomyces sp. NPDC057376]|uniref:ABC transporter ATP-binding protein n=1 Tax=unclassified Streptomyces TaxID=2593676 RepID=UPI000AF9E7E2|nr:ABC transporter ATP-binding protein [Streptomyces sp. CB02414]